MDELKKRVEEALKILDPTNEEPTWGEKQKAFLVIKEALSLLFE